MNRKVPISAVAAAAALVALAALTVAVPASAAYMEITPPAGNVTASIDDGNVAGNVVDNDGTTRWSGFGDGTWLQLDLGGTKLVSHLKVAVHNGTSRMNDFELQVWNGSSWVTVFDGRSSGSTAGLESYDFADMNGSKVRYVGHGYYNTDGSFGGLWNSVTEVEIWSEGTPPPTSSPAPNAPLPVAGVSASGDDGNVPANTLDNDLSTRWSQGGDGVWIRYDLGNSVAVGSLQIAWHNGNQRVSTFDVQTSTDASVWTTVITGGQSSGGTLQPEVYDFTDRTARHVRIVGHGNTQNNWTSITEVDIWGTGGATPTPTLSASSPPRQTLGVGGVATPPGAVLVANQSSKYTINSGGTATAPKVYDCQGNTIRGGVLINADHVVIQNCRVDAQQQYGIYSDNNTNVTIQNNDIKGVKAPGDLNAITFFGNGHKIFYNTAINFVTGDPGDSHTDFIQTWVSSSHPTASDDVQICGNKAVGPANPDRDTSVPSIHQWLMVEDYGRGGNSGGNTDGMRNWIVADNELGDSWNQAIKLDGPDNVSITRNRFVGSSTKVMEVTSASAGVKFYSDNQVGQGYGSVGMTVTAGAGPACLV